MQCESRVGTCALDMLKGRQNSGLEPYSKAKEKKSIRASWVDISKSPWDFEKSSLNASKKLSCTYAMRIQSRDVRS